MDWYQLRRREMRGRFLCGDGTWKGVVVEPDYTVFDIVMEISSSGNLSIS